MPTRPLDGMATLGCYLLSKAAVIEVEIKEEKVL